MTIKNLLIIILAALFLFGCSDDESPAEPEQKNEFEKPDVILPEMECPENVSTAAANGNEGAMIAEAAIGMVTDCASAFEDFMPPNANKESFKKIITELQTYQWTVDELTITLEIENWANDLIFITMYYDGSDGFHTYEHWTKGFFNASLSDWMGAYQIYEYGNPDPIIAMNWGYDDFIQEYFAANWMDLIKVHIDMEDITAIPPFTNDPPGSFMEYEMNGYVYTITLYANGHGTWQKHEGTILEPGELVDQGEF